MNCLANWTINRRSFLFNAALAATAAGGTLTPLARAVAAAADDLEVMTWTSCVVNCGSRCPLRAFTKNGRVIRIEPENTGADSTKMPAEARLSARTFHASASLFFRTPQVSDEARRQARGRQV